MIKFCGNCGTTITRSDIALKRAIRSGKFVYCTKCAEKLGVFPSKDDDPPSDTGGEGGRNVDSPDKVNAGAASGANPGNPDKKLVTCPSCGTKLKIKITDKKKKVKCPKCRDIFTVDPAGGEDGLVIKPLIQEPVSPPEEQSAPLPEPEDEVPAPPEPPAEPPPTPLPEPEDEVPAPPEPPAEPPPVAAPPSALEPIVPIPSESSDDEALRLEGEPEQQVPQPFGEDEEPAAEQLQDIPAEGIGSEGPGEEEIPPLMEKDEEEAQPGPPPTVRTTRTAGSGSRLAERQGSSASRSRRRMQSRKKSGREAAEGRAAKGLVLLLILMLVSGAAPLVIWLTGEGEHVIQDIGKKASAGLIKLGIPGGGDTGTEPAPDEKDSDAPADTDSTGDTSKDSTEAPVSDGTGATDSTGPE